MSSISSPTKPTVFYGVEPTLDAESFRRVLDESGLGRIRPTGDLLRLQAMLSAADLIVTARLAVAGGPLVGVARCLTDHAWCCYLSDLAVVSVAQGQRIGQGLLDEVRRHLGPQVALILLSVPEAAAFYQRAGMERIADAFWYPRER
ncbi:GNAT family N-acetyltransferase [Hydrogenophaga sp. SL48]|uniref:GNAT family N-acetyltransferase n=1 Tax=Hydrogenophaga sp. SL48 TaxID=2806347 RepID=UPI001F3E7C92|nr:GNAT family N-acetyltransferase [Hydrogenophaga sp. SL48]UJW79209.1 GNAT family N-acetyltransferase [Hydrogenophaga sp. SL48]